MKIKTLKHSLIVQHIESSWSYQPIRPLQSTSLPDISTRSRYNERYKNAQVLSSKYHRHSIDTKGYIINTASTPINTAPTAISSTATSQHITTAILSTATSSTQHQHKQLFHQQLHHPHSNSCTADFLMILIF